jgi:hypothetical protein
MRRGPGARVHATATVAVANSIRQNVISYGEMGAERRTNVALVEKKMTASTARMTPDHVGVRMVSGTA